jgi:hypothetical protein
MNHMRASVNVKTLASTYGTGYEWAINRRNREPIAELPRRLWTLCRR